MKYKLNESNYYAFQEIRNWYYNNVKDKEICRQNNKKTQKSK